jgi:hypothetical protein
MCGQRLVFGSADIMAQPHRRLVADIATGYPAEAPLSAQNRHFRPLSADSAESALAGHIGS